MRPFREVLRFWSRVRRSPAGCWTWTGAVDPDGYGVFWTSGEGAKKVRAHRYSWELHARRTTAQLVLHRCDVPACVNPSHLFLGSHLVNIRDRNRKGRAPSTAGEQNGSARLTRADVDSIRAARSKGTKTADLATKYGVTAGNITKITTKQSWKS